MRLEIVEFHMNLWMGGDGGSGELGGSLDRRRSCKKKKEKVKAKKELCPGLAGDKSLQCQKSSAA
jgi:hypothetical protein